MGGHGQLLHHTCIPDFVPVNIAQALVVPRRKMRMPLNPNGQRAQDPGSFNTGVVIKSCVIHFNFDF